jgi:hypothetical protein
MTTTRKVYNEKYKEVRIETYVNGEFYTDKVIKYSLNNTDKLPLQ